MKLPDSKLDKLLKLSRKRYKWAIGTDVILIIVFVLLCTSLYHYYIHGSYNGDAIHCISEINNDSYEYFSSESEQSDGDQISSQELELLEKGTSSINEIQERYNHTIMNPELKGPISSVGSKWSNRSHKI